MSSISRTKSPGAQTSLETHDRAEAQRLLQAQNEAQHQPHFKLALARVYLNGADPKLGTRTWQEVMEHIVGQKTDVTRRRMRNHALGMEWLWKLASHP